MKKIVLVAAVLASIVTTTANADSSWMTKVDLLDTAKNFALIMDNKIINVPDQDRSVAATRYGFDMIGALDNVITKGLNANVTCDKIGTDVGNWVNKQMIQSNDLTSAQIKYAVRFRNASVNYTLARCADLS